jgi:multidrug resistance efflux pump
VKRESSSSSCAFLKNNTSSAVADQQAAVAELVSLIKSDQAAIENAKAELSYTSLVAPFDGVTGFRLLDVGNMIHPPTTQTTCNEDALVVVTELQPIKTQGRSHLRIEMAAPIPASYLGETSAQIN